MPDELYSAHKPTVPADSKTRCARCGCPQSTLLFTGQRWGKEVARRRCRHCGRDWFEPTGKVVEQLPEGVVVYKPAETGGAKCPKCGAFPVRVKSAPKNKGGGPRVRYHTCACGWEGKSQESA